MRNLRILVALSVIIVIACRKEQPPPPPTTATTTTAAESGGVDVPVTTLFEAGDFATGVAVDDKKFIPPRVRATEFAPGQLFFFSIHIKGLADPRTFTGNIYAADGTSKFEQSKEIQPGTEYVTFMVMSSDAWPKGDYNATISIGPEAVAGSGPVRIGNRAEPRQ